MKGRTGGSLWAEDYAFLITTRVPLLLPVRLNALPVGKSVELSMMRRLVLCQEIATLFIVKLKTKKDFQY